MYFNIKPRQNQINSIEEMNTVNNAAGNTFLNVTKSHTYLLQVINNCKIFINLSVPDLNTQYYSEFTLIIESVGIDKEITFDKNVLIDSFTNFSLLTSKNRYFLFTFFTYDNGSTWIGTLIGHYDYDINQTIILRPILSTGSYKNIISIKNPRCLCKGFESNTGLLNYDHSDWKLTSDDLGYNIIKFDNNITDEVYHEFDSTGLIEDNYYYIFTRHYSATKVSNWSYPIKVQVKNREVSNPNDFRQNWYTYQYYSDTRIHHWYDPTLITRWVKTNSNNTDIITIVDSTTIGNATILGNQYVELNGIQGVLTSIQIYFGNSEFCDIRLIPDDAQDFSLYCPSDKNYDPSVYSTFVQDGIFYTQCNLFIYSRLKIIFNENCIVKHIDFTLI